MSYVRLGVCATSTILFNIYIYDLTIHRHFIKMKLLPVKLKIDINLAEYFISFILYLLKVIVTN